MFKKAFLLTGLLALALAGCGSEKDAAPVAKTVGAALKGLGKPKAAAAGAPALTQAALAQYKTPMIMVEIPTMQLFTFVVPYGQNGSIETWASADKKTLAFRDGLVVGTRGFGADIMQASGPSLAQIAAGQGQHKRIYVYLDGADQSQRYEFDCVLQDRGRSNITVVERQHTVRHIAESCTGKGAEFTNEYWIENGNFLRKSNQLINTSWGPMVLTRVIDNART
ncbi:hypothetical protein GCM10007315_10910 [Gemmobacter tilapiae]|uniref:YjbF family lipoprotein n=2 Tax=Neogemmobacter tilapiae TaxID=875041 RepID=A0A918TJ68_9RHOB|nr:hypothetical protein GCM10007315_10910 [Gemmobacter tilapiae]